MAKQAKKRIATLMACVCCVVTLTAQPFAASADKVLSPTAMVDTFSSSPSEGTDYGSYAAAVIGGVPADTALTPEGKLDDTWTVNDEIHLSVTVPQERLYGLTLTYQSLKQQDVVLALDIDGTVPFDEAKRITFPAYWVNDSDPHVDEAGNQFSPDQTLYDGFLASEAMDYTGRYEGGYRLLLGAGEHTLTLTVVQGEFTLSGVQLTAPAVVAPYTAPAVTKMQTEPIILEGEDAYLKNSRSLIPQADFGSVAVNPCDPVLNLLNYIGGTNWKSPGSSLTWQFHVEKTGYYAISFNYRQDELLGGISYRHLKIDGCTPFDEARRVKFTYDADWQYMTLGTDEAPYWLYLEEGDHTLSLAVTMGAMAELYDRMQMVVEQMGDLYVDITKIVGETVDIYRSYELFNQIPQFNERLQQAADMLNSIAADMETLQEQSSGSTVSSVRNAVRVVQLMLDNPYTAHRHKDDFYDAYSTLSALLGEMPNMPLDIDRIVMTAAGSPHPDFAPSFWERLVFSGRRFIASFLEDYAEAEKGEGQSRLKIWVNWGRDQAKVLDNLVRDSFTRDTGIPVDISIANASLIQAILSGTGPDCMLQLTRTEPVNYAMRGALYDLSQFPDAQDVLTRFNDGADIPYRYRGGLYALPDTQSFYMMFLRTDILETMGVEAPTTWEEFLDVAMLLQRNNLQAWVPITLYPTLLMQNGLSLYKEDETATMLTQPKQIAAFTEYVNWYTEYQLPENMNFYNRFRLGSAPIGIDNYTVYTQFKATAPEIAGRWTMVPLPGTLREDGTVDFTSAGTGTGCSITQYTSYPEEAWEFLKWWTETDTQMAYSGNVESVIGALGRVAVSNTQALQAMDWETSMLDALMKQATNTDEFPEVPGGYYTTRSIDQAFWAVVEQGTGPLEAMTKWGHVADLEIQRKRAEYIHD